MPTLSGLLKIEYIHQPQYLWRRLVTQLTGRVRDPHNREFHLPWGLTIEANPQEEHGKILQTLGVIDLVVTESIWRLLAADSTFLDVGANIGYMTSVAVARLEQFPHSTGKAIAYEPHPIIYKSLQQNVDRWRINATQTQISLHQIALSDRSGSTQLAIPVDFAGNQGLAQVIHTVDDLDRVDVPLPHNQNVARLSIDCQRLDDCFASNEIVTLMKIDVEGHELAVFKGASQHLQSHRIHHIIFEAHDGYPSDVTSYLEQYGYQIFGVERQLSGPHLVTPGSTSETVNWLPRNYIATGQPAALERAFSQGGWQVFK